MLALMQKSIPLDRHGLSSCAMILAAGMSTRMRPLTDKLPKPLIKLSGKPLIDHVIDALQQAGIKSVAVNLHYHADQLENYLQARPAPRVIFSDEREKILDSGLGAKKMLTHVGGKAFLLANADTIWTGTPSKTIERLIARWDPQQMDILLLLAPTASSLGYDGRGDFTCDAQGRLIRRGEQAVAPFAYAGVAIFKPELFDGTPGTPFSLNLLFDRAIEAGRLYGLPLDGIWMHVGTPQALRDAEALLAGAA